MLIFGHRGVRRTLPENTLASLLAARELGADGVEFDVRLTRDGVAVLYHDETLDRLHGLPRRVADLTWAELRSLTAAGPAPVAALAEVLEALSPDLYLDVEIKDPRAAPHVARLLVARGRAGRVAVSCFEAAVLGVPDLATSGIPRWLNANEASDRALGLAVTASAAALIVPVEHVSAGAIVRAAAAGLTMGCWGFMDASTLDRLRSLGCAVAIPDLPWRDAGA